MPVIVMGDLNDELGSRMYSVMTGAGFENVWAVLRPRLDERIDHVFGSVRGTIFLTGRWPWERVRGPYYKLWPSDHAGVFASLKLPR
jgi:endonuclease/exonuclease/phosphatase family metal-dependent hydrolase